MADPVQQEKKKPFALIAGAVALAFSGVAGFAGFVKDTRTIQDVACSALGAFCAKADPAETAAREYLREIITREISAGTARTPEDAKKIENALTYLAPRGADAGTTKAAGEGLKFFSALAKNNPEVRAALRRLLDGEMPEGLAELNAALRSEAVPTPGADANFAAIAYPLDPKGKSKSLLDDIDHTLAPIATPVAIKIVGHPDGRIKDGQLAQFDISARVSGRLIILDRTNAGEVALLAPNALDPKGVRVDMDRRVQIPAPDAPFAFEYVLDDGDSASERGRVFAIVVPEADADVLAYILDPKRDPTGDPAAVSLSYQTVVDFVGVLNGLAKKTPHSASAWGIGTLDYEVVK